MSIEEAIERIDALVNDIQAETMQNMGAASMDLIEKISSRVITEQKDANGKTFDAYSQKKIPASSYFTSAKRVKKGLNELQAASKRGEKMSYADFRQLLGHSNRAKSFELSGEMWSGFGIVRTDDGQEMVVIGGRNKAAQERIAWNSQREGISIIAASDEEIQEFIDYRVDWLRGLFVKNNLI
jgi:hypothetical protein